MTYTNRGPVNLPTLLGEILARQDIAPGHIYATHLLKIAAELILYAVGEDPDREGLKGTPDRFMRAWMEFMNYEPGNVETVFEQVEANQMVVVSGMRVWSFCEHHLLPFFADVSIGYIARDKVLGLSKFARIAHKHAHRLQVQERLVRDIAEDIRELVGEDVAVVASGRHLCMEMRGVRTIGTMTTSVMWGAFQDEDSARAEFLALHREATNGK